MQISFSSFFFSSYSIKKIYWIENLKWQTQHWIFFYSRHLSVPANLSLSLNDSTGKRGYKPQILVPIFTGTFFLYWTGTILLRVRVNLLPSCQSHNCWLSRPSHQNFKDMISLSSGLCFFMSSQLSFISLFTCTFSLAAFKILSWFLILNNFTMKYTGVISHPWGSLRSFDLWFIVFLLLIKFGRILCVTF